jgi:exodeoxyribonuclease III
MSDLRIATWNCARGPLQAKLDALEAIAPHVAVLTEAPQPKSALDGAHWFGVGRYGVLVQARAPYRIEVLPAAADLPPCVSPVRVEGPRSFTLLAVWTWAAPSYKRALLEGLAAYRSLPGPFVVAGDFNGNPRFDEPRTRLKWAACFEEVERLGVASVYHEIRGEPYGGEKEHTYYHRPSENAPFHIDYCFAPREWMGGLQSVNVGDFDAWQHLSDHRPVWAEFAFTA